MQVNLNQIVASDSPIRTTWSEDEMMQLVDSIKQWGVIQAVKLRPCELMRDGGYEGADVEIFEIVDGHRRIEASRRAGMEYIEATIEGMDDQTALIQSLIANVHREGNTPVDTGNALKSIINTTGWTMEEIAHKCSKKQAWVGQHISLVNDDDAIQSQFNNPGYNGGKRLSEHHARAIRKVEIPTEEKVQILEKAQEEDLGWAKTEQVAKAVKAADELGDTRAKEALIAEPYSPLMHDPEIVKERHERFAKTSIPDPMYIRTDKKQPSFAQSQQNEWDRLPRAKVILDYLKKWNGSLADFRNADEIGKLSPEGKRFIIRRLNEFAGKLNDWKQSIEDEL